MARHVRLSFVPDVTGLKPFRKLNFSLVCPQNILGLEDHHDVFWQIRDECFCSFWSAVVFALETLPWMPFWPSLFLIGKSQMQVRPSIL